MKILLNRLGDLNAIDGDILFNDSISNYSRFVLEGFY